MPLVLEPSWVGRRVSIRRIAALGPDHRPRFRDVVGDLLEMTSDQAVVATRNGPVQVPLAVVAAAKLAPASTAEELALQRALARDWRAEQTGELGGWVLRACSGATRRANSVLPLGAPGLALDQALGAARRWYQERGLPLQLQVPVESRRLLDAELADRGWPASEPVHVLAARIDILRAAAPLPTAPVQLAAAPGEQWLARYGDGSRASAAAVGLLTRHDRVRFAAVRSDAGVVAIGRGTVQDDWLGVSAVRVAPARRRQGLASAILGALWAWGEAEGAERSHAAVSAEQAETVALYTRLGYWVHHDYRYRTDPGP